MQRRTLPWPDALTVNVTSIDTFLAVLDHDMIECGARARVRRAHAYARDLEINQHRDALYTCGRRLVNDKHAVNKANQTQAVIESSMQTLSLGGRGCPASGTLSGHPQAAHGSVPHPQQP